MDDKQAVIDRLREYQSLFAEILDLLGDKPRLIGAEQDHARQLLRSLKDRLKNDCRELEQRPLSHYEKTALVRSLRQATAEITVPVNTIPNHRWRSNLSGAKITLDMALSRID